MLDFVNRHSSVNHLGELVHELRVAMGEDESSDDEQPNMGVRGVALTHTCTSPTPCTVPTFKGHNRVKLGNYAAIHSFGGLDTSLRFAYAGFERSLRIFVYEVEHGEPPGTGPRFHTIRLPDLDSHSISCHNCLQLPLTLHPHVACSQTMRCSVPMCQGQQPGRMDCVAVRMPTEADDGGEVMCVARVLMFFTCLHKGHLMECAFMWWFTEQPGGADSTGCLRYERSWQMRPEGTNNRLLRRPWTEVVLISRIMYRVHMVPSRQAGTWLQSNENFRLNKWVLQLPL
jgi:hypothetical protein